MPDSVLVQKLKEILLKKGFIRYFKNTSWLMVEHFLRIIASLFVGIWLAKYLGPDQYGLFSYAQSFVLPLFSVLATLGLDGIIVKRTC